MRSLLSLLFGLAVLQCVGAQDTRDIYLLNITIFTDHEAADLLFGINSPEVYLSCDDGRPSVDLDQVRDVGQLYTFNSGELNVARLEEGECVTCTLKESDATPLLEDDTFGQWSMCEADFAETGLLIVEVPDEFLVMLECPECIAPDVSTTTATESQPEQTSVVTPELDVAPP